MNASKIAKIVGSVSTILVGIALVSCGFWESPPQKTVRPVICDGEPDWCLVVKSDMDAHRPAYVYMDGEMHGLVLPSNTTRIAVKAGEAHQIKFCAYMPIGDQLRWKCSTPVQMTFDSDDSITVALPF